MRNLEAVQQGLRIVRDALAPTVERVLTDQFGQQWWQRGVLDALVQDGKPIHDRPTQGNAGDMDLQLALKLVQVYHWELFSDDLGWGGRERSLLNAVTAVRNQYEGHVTPNREAELTDGKTRDLMEGMELFLSLLDRRAANRIADLVEGLKRPEPAEERPSEPVILRRPVVERERDPGRSDPQRVTRPPQHRQEPVLRNGAAEQRSVPEQAKPAWQRKPQVRWGAAVRAPGERPAEPEEPAPRREPEKAAARPPRQPEPRRMAAERRLRPAQREPEPPTEPETSSRRKRAARDPKPMVEMVGTMPGRGTTPQQRPDPQLYTPVPIRRSTPRRLQRQPYEVEVRTERNRRGESVLRAEDPRRRASRDRKEPEARTPVDTAAVLRITAMVLLGVGLGIGLILLEGCLR